jgi:hypothetical protein
MKAARVFLFLAGAVLLITGIAKCVSGFGHGRILELSDPILFLTFRCRCQSSLFALFDDRNRFETWLQLPICRRPASQGRFVVVSARNRRASLSFCLASAALSGLGKTA